MIGKAFFFLLILMSVAINAHSISVKDDFFRNSVKFYGEETITLENDLIHVKIRTRGAELTSIFNKQSGVEHLWQADQAIWKWQAPILFPIVGKLKNGKYKVDGNEYKLKIHGFARHSEFSLIKKSATEVIFELSSSAESLKVYPYKFKLLIKYQLSGRKIDVNYQIINTDTKEIYFSIGAHPGFNVPFFEDGQFTDYYLEFEKKEVVNRLLTSVDKGFLTGEISKTYLDNTNRLDLNHELFNKRVIVLENLKSTYVRIKSDDSTHAIKIGIANFPYVGIWSVPEEDANFVCIEPWYGVTDAENATGKFAEKKGIQSLAAGKTFTAVYYIEVE